MRRLGPALLPLILGVSAGCTGTRTEVLVHLATDLEEDALDTIRVRVVGPDGERERVLARRGPDGDLLPGTFGVSPLRGDPTRMLTVIVEGGIGSQVVVTATRTIEQWVEGKKGDVYVFLSRACARPSESLCGPGLECGPCGCEAEIVSPYDPEPPASWLGCADAGSADGGGEAPLDTAGSGDGGVDAPDGAMDPLDAAELDAACQVTEPCGSLGWRCGAGTGTFGRALDCGRCAEGSGCVALPCECVACG